MGRTMQAGDFRDQMNLSFQGETMAKTLTMRQRKTGFSYERLFQAQQTLKDLTGEQQNPNVVTSSPKQKRREDEIDYDGDNFYITKIPK